MLKSDELEIDMAQADPNTPKERKLAAAITKDLMNAENTKRDFGDDTGLSIEDMWEDEYKLLKGGGLQWSTHFAYRNQRDRRRRPNSEDNFIHTAITVQTANLTATEPEILISGKAEHEDQTKQLTHMVRYLAKKYNFGTCWKEMIKEFVAYGPLCVEVCWDSEIMGGSGPDRYIGDIQVNQIPKEDMLFDPNVVDLEKDMGRCKFAGFRSRAHVNYIRKRWPKYKDSIVYDVNDDPLVSEGTEQESTYLYKVYYKGFPEFMPAERKQELQQRAALAEDSPGEFYKAQDLYDMAEGEVEGVHVAYICNDVLLEYIPYVYDHGEYPFVFRTRYKDTKNQWGYGEIRNTKIPQILHNKADEIEIEAMVKEGLGGGYFEGDAVSKAQLDNILANSGRSGMWFRVNNINGMKERSGIKVPGSITNYKEHKQRMVETVSVNPAVSQGQMPSANAPYKAVSMLSSKVDIKTKNAADKLKDFLVDVTKLQLKLMEQFYTHDRYYRYKDTSNKMHEGTFNRGMMQDEWERDVVDTEIIDPTTGEVGIMPVSRMEKYVPDFDIEINVISKKPEDRDYYTNLAFHLHELGILTDADLIKTLEEGRLPDGNEILENSALGKPLKELMLKLQEFPPEAQAIMNEEIQRTVDMVIQQLMAGMQARGQQEQLNQGGQVEERL